MVKTSHRRGLWGAVRPYQAARAVKRTTLPPCCMTRPCSSWTSLPSGLTWSPRSACASSLLIGRISARYRIRDLQVREPDIEAAIRRIYEERLLEKDNQPKGN